LRGIYLLGEALFHIKAADKEKSEISESIGADPHF
jgi:hypothetical protein